MFDAKTSLPMEFCGPTCSKNLSDFLAHIHNDNLNIISPRFLMACPVSGDARCCQKAPVSVSDDHMMFSFFEAHAFPRSFAVVHGAVHVFDASTGMAGLCASNRGGMKFNSVTSVLQLFLARDDLFIGGCA